MPGEVPDVPPFTGAADRGGDAFAMSSIVRSVSETVVNWKSPRPQSGNRNQQRG